jgi:hypothetical protein
LVSLLSVWANASQHPGFPNRLLKKWPKGPPHPFPGKTLPDRFVLELSSNLSRWCRVVWRSDQAVGVQFTPDVSAETDDASKTTAADATDIRRPVMITCKRTGKPI